MGRTGKEAGGTDALTEGVVHVGYPDEVIASRGVLDEGVEYIAKPFTPEVLLARVRAALAKSSNRARGESPVGSG